MAIKFVDVDPIVKPIPIRPVAHYSMGGIETDIDGKTRVAGIWAAGEAACVSLHGANRLGSNSTAECLGGEGSPERISSNCPNSPAPPSMPPARVRGHSPITPRIGKAAPEPKTFTSSGANSGRQWTTNVGVYRTGENLRKRWCWCGKSRSEPAKAKVGDDTAVYNSNLFHAFELENLLDLAEVTVTGALTREESRGAHARRDFPTRDDVKWLKHTLAWYTGKGPRLDYKPVTIDTLETG